MIQRLLPAILALLPLSLAQTPTLPDGFRPLKGTAYLVLPFPEDLTLPKVLQGQITGLRVVLVGKTPLALPRTLQGLPLAVRRHLRDPRLPPMLVGPNWAYLPGLGWTDNLQEVGTLLRLLEEAWARGFPLEGR